MHVNREARQFAHCLYTIIERTIRRPGKKYGPIFFNFELDRLCSFQLNERDMDWEEFNVSQEVIRRIRHLAVSICFIGQIVGGKIDLLTVDLSDPEIRNEMVYQSLGEFEDLESISYKDHWCTHGVIGALGFRMFVFEIPKSFPTYSDRQLMELHEYVAGGKKKTHPEWKAPEIKAVGFRWVPTTKASLGTVGS
jgi:hypothetical protein